MLKITIQVDMEVWKLIKDSRQGEPKETINSSLRRLLKMEEQ